MGNILINIILLDDEEDKKGYFYIVPDLSIRVEDRYRLKFDLLLSILISGLIPLLGSNQVAVEYFSDIEYPECYIYTNKIQWWWDEFWFSKEDIDEEDNQGKEIRIEGLVRTRRWNYENRRWEGD
jgi:hypothetical protein